MTSMPNVMTSKHKHKAVVKTAQTLMFDSVPLFFYSSFKHEMMHESSPLSLYHPLPPLSLYLSHLSLSPSLPPPPLSLSPSLSSLSPPPSPPPLSLSLSFSLSPSLSLSL